MTTNIYILRLQNGAYYVGKSDDPMRRYQEHLEGRGSAWTRLHRPVAVERIIPGASPFDEDKITKELMAKHGIDKVRGGAYVSTELDDVQEEALQRELWASTDKCTTCGRAGHFAANCYARTKVSSESKRGVICYRCGSPGHYSPECSSGSYVKVNTTQPRASNNCYRNRFTSTSCKHKQKYQYNSEEDSNDEYESDEDYDDEDDEYESDGDDEYDEDDYY
jgi:predicted GIY-YIG superfamily endonuclease